MASTSAPRAVATPVAPRSAPLVVFGLMMAAFIVFTHRSNVQRMRDGNESRARRLWLLRPR
ncbi:MAG: hypothetical protein IPF50_07020 [Proteobacteria bacterium]|nr:hypothetical protein [Pseudomonadota bacterium]